LLKIANGRSSHHGAPSLAKFVINFVCQGLKARRTTAPAPAGRDTFPYHSLA
jgi:hypothetical protein